VNELCEVCKQIELEFERFSLGGYDALTIFAILAIALRGFTAASSNVESKRVLPLFSQTFRTDVRVPDHTRGDQRVRHFATCEGKVREAFVTGIRLIDEDAVAVSFEWSAATGCATRCVVAKGYVS